MDIGSTLPLLEKLKADGELFISLSPPHQASFEFDRQVLRRALEASSLTEDEFRRAAAAVSEMLLAVLADKVDEFVRHGQRYLGDEEEAEEQEDSAAAHERLREDVKKVQATLWDEHLQRRYDLKSSSKAPSFTDIDWDIKIKVVDAHLEALKPFPYATCRISFQREFDASPLTFLSGKAYDSVQINFTVDEVDYMLRVLTTVKDHLDLLETEEGK